MYQMEKTEASLVPGWLKVASGSNLSIPNSGFFQDNGNKEVYPRSRSQQAGGNIDSSRWSTSSERVFFPVPRRAQSNIAIDKVNSDRNEGHVHSSLNHSLSAALNYEASEKEKQQDRVGNEIDAFHIYDSENNCAKESRFMRGSVLNNSESEKMSGFVESIIPGKYDPDAKLRRIHSMGLSARISDSYTLKMNGTVNISPPMSSVKTALVTGVQKTVFDRNFPSLCSDDKSPTSSTNGSVLSPCTTWQKPLQMDLGRTASPGLSGGVNGLSHANGYGSGDVWNSALAEIHMSNGNSRQNSHGVIGPPVTSGSGHLPATGAVLNMAEALVQTPPRVRTPPQVSTESQRLEELALKQSRQLIPVPPPLPKTMSLADKGKSKSSRALDGATACSKQGVSTHLVASHKSITTNRPDNIKHSQGKLLVLKPTKDNGGVTDGVESNHGVSNGSSASSQAGNASSLIGQRKKLPDNRDIRPKDLLEEKKTSTQAQNRSDFFNTLRKKAATSGEVFMMAVRSESLDSNNTLQSKGETAPIEGSGNSCNVEAVGLKRMHNNEILDHTTSSGSISDQVDSLREERKADEVMDSEEEEAAFMRSLGWEENGEGDELTEEEINSFYQLMREKNIFNNVNHCNIALESIESTSSSDSDPDLKSV